MSQSNALPMTQNIVGPAGILHVDDGGEGVDGTSHWLQMDKPEEFNRLLDEFLARIP